jgi:YD repeat-containing protein
LNKKYTACVWLYVPGEAETQVELNKIQLYCRDVNGVVREVHPQLQKNKSKSWYLLNLDFSPNGNPVTVEVRNNSSRGAYFDDFRVHPMDASMASYVYDQTNGELTYVLDVKNFYTKFEYDGLGRLVRTSKELLNFDFGDGKETFRADKTLSEVKYNYGKNNQ